MDRTTINVERSNGNSEGCCCYRKTHRNRKCDRIDRFIIQMILLSLMLCFSQTNMTDNNVIVLAWIPKTAPVTNSWRQLQTIKPLQNHGSLLALRFFSSSSNCRSSTLSLLSSTTRTENLDIDTLEGSIAQLKRVLEREYISFFNPMEREYYQETVTFIDPLTQLTGIDKYQNNVDMLSGRTFVGSVLFRDARIILHSISGGQLLFHNSTAAVSRDSSNIRIENIITRWTLRFTFQILPWLPTPSFTGTSVYTVQQGGPKNVQIVQQNDYWDAINLQPGGVYASVPNNIALQHFVSQLLPTNLKAISAGPELPYTTLRLGSDYEVRRYPSYIAMQMIYDRRDEAFVAMGSYTNGT
jgi:hypothetical protein